MKHPDEIPASHDHDAVCIITVQQGREKIVPLVKPYYYLVPDMDKLQCLPYMLPVHYGEEGFSYRLARPFNFYESPFLAPSESRFVKRMDHLNAEPVPEIAWNIAGQELFLQYLMRVYPEFCADLKTFVRYRPDNSMFCLSDALTLYGMLRSHMPQRIIEIGSGFSTKLAMDTAEIWYGGQTQITCIEPYPHRLLSGLAEHPYANLHLVQEMVQDIDLAVFDTLEAGDILFIDSSHVVKHGGDIPFELFTILPRLASGVRVHFHDIFYPFTYPEAWIKDGIPYTEAYALRAFLSYNQAYEMLYFSSMMAQYVDQGTEHFFKATGTNGGSLWLQKK